MTAALGTLALLTGLAASVGWTILWLSTAVSGRMVRGADAATWLALGGAVAACGALEWALVTHDFSISYVAENGGRHVPLYFSVTSLWAALDGSILLWLFFLTTVGVLLARGGRGSAEHPWAMAAVGIVAVFFFALAYFAANPFEAAERVVADGPGPNPLLREHPAMGIHPPLLYAGYIGMVVPFGYAIAALVTGGGDQGWLADARRWALGAWILLTAGIVGGAWWSYAVLGWGGYWVWDPVENASLMPWLTATAALHVTLRRRTGGLQGWAAMLFGVTFLLVLVGTFLTRSGAVSSVHSFTQSPLGPMLLGFTLLAVLVTAMLLIARGRRLEAGTGSLRPGEGAFLLNAVLLLAVAAVVLTGTVYPLISELLSGRAVAVSETYYHRAAVPLLLVVLAVMGTAQLLIPDRTDVARRLLIPGCAGLAVIALVGLLSRPSILALLAFGVAAYVLVGAATVWTSGAHRRMRPGLIAHAGAALVTIGIAASSSYSAVTLRELGLGEGIQTHGISAELVRIDRNDAPDRSTASARVVLTQQDSTLGTVTPRLHYYPARDMTVGVPAIRSRLWGDTYVTLTSVTEDGQRATLRLAVNPFVSLIWSGGAVIAAGGLFALLRRRSETAVAAIGPPDLVGTEGRQR